MSRKYIQAKKTTLSYSISDSETAMRLDRLLKLNGTSFTASDIGSFMTFTFDPGTAKEEICSITSANVTFNADGTVELVNVVRGLKDSDDYLTGGFASDHGAGAVVVFSNNPQLYNQLANKFNPNTFSEIQTFTLLPTTPAGNATDNSQFITYGQALSLLTGSATVNRIVVAGTAGTTITIGQCLFFDVATGRWALTNATIAGTVNGTLKGIAQGAGTNGNPVTNGVLIVGLAGNQTGRTPGAVQFFSDTPGALSEAPGTVEVTAGQAQTATDVVFFPSFNQQLTEDQQDALTGSFNAPADNNRYVTELDVATLATANRIARRLATGAITVPVTPINDSDAVSKVYADGTTTLVAGEAFTGATTPQPVKLISDLIQPFIDTNYGIGTSSITRVALRIIPRSNCTIGSVVMAYTYPTDPTVTITATIQTESGGLPSGTAIANGTSSALQLNTAASSGFSYVNYPFATPPSLVAGTTYWVVMTLSSTTSGQVLIPGIASGSTYASFQGRTWNGSWSTSFMPAIELISATGESSSLWRSDGNGIFQTNGFDAFVTQTVSAGASVNVRSFGDVPGFTGLDAGADYYLSNTIGTITRNRNEGGHVGRATSATQIIIPRMRTKDVFFIGSLPIASVGSAQMTAPILFLEDGILSLNIKPGTSGGNTITTVLASSRTYANATYPGPLIKAIIGATTGITMQEMPVTVTIKKGERVCIYNQSSAGGTTASNLTFTPI